MSAHAHVHTHSCTRGKFVEHKLQYVGFKRGTFCVTLSLAPRSRRIQLEGKGGDILGSRAILLPRFFQQVPAYFLRARYSEIHEAERDVIVIKTRKAERRGAGRRIRENLISRDRES